MDAQSDVAPAKGAPAAAVPNIERLVDVYHSEIKIAAHSFFLWKHLNSAAAADPELNRGLNQNPMVWSVLLHSLQTTFFISLGKLFDPGGDSLSSAYLLSACAKNIDQFSKKAFEARRLRGCGSGRPNYLDEYLEGIYVPTELDFLRLKPKMKEGNDLYKEAVRPIRHLIIAHRDVRSIDREQAIYAGLKVGQLQELINLHWQLEQALYQLLHNGRPLELEAYQMNFEKEVEAEARSLLEQIRPKPRQ